jgi:hypothetical protein
MTAWLITALVLVTPVVIVAGAIVAPPGISWT